MLKIEPKLATHKERKHTTLSAISPTLLTRPLTSGLKMKFETLEATRTQLDGKVLCISPSCHTLLTL